ncbi:hypothetical protein [Streptomyces sp. NPDC004296]|uniref:hypothetical protein n=1 Tax=Streptomyces sp. NPDC004296 TaxID=3364697 RepID=UPI003693864F
MSADPRADRREHSASPARLRVETTQARFRAALARHDAEQAAGRLAATWTTGETPS